MLLRPSFQDFLGIGHGLGRFALFLGLLSLLPVLVSIGFGEWFAALRLAEGAFCGIFLGLCILHLFPNEAELSTPGAFTLAALVWIEATLLIGLTYLLTGHCLDFTDACFDAMSGFTTTGLVLMQDLDHVPEGVQFLRHGVTFLGGQGIVVLFLALASRSSPALFQLYVGEGKDERLWPSVLHTARSIWRISFLYLSIGVAILAPLLWHMGMSPVRAVLEALYLFEGAWSTGGFAPHSQNLLYYHSAWIEGLTALFFVLGSMNFLVHHHLLRANLKEVWRDLEIRSMALTLSLMTVVAAAICWSAGIYPTIETSLRKVGYHMVSAHTTTGNMTLYARQLYHDWPVSALFLVILAMVIGGSACSTAGGIKGIRIGQLFKMFQLEGKRVLLPPSAIPIVRYHHGSEILLSTDHVYKALFITFLFLLLFAGTTVAGIIAGFPPIDALFEGVSASSNSGLSIGVTTVAMPVWLKWVYIVAMWLGRLEFTAVLVAIAYGWSCIWGK